MRSKELNKTKPPKDRDFLALIVSGNHVYWDIFFWATKEDGINGKSAFTDRDLYYMPKIEGWLDLPDIKV